MGMNETMQNDGVRKLLDAAFAAATCDCKHGFTITARFENGELVELDVFKLDRKNEAAGADIRPHRRQRFTRLAGDGSAANSCA